MTESLEKAEQCANLLVADLREAYQAADAVAAMVIMPLIEQAARMEQSLQTLRRACAEVSQCHASD